MSATPEKYGKNYEESNPLSKKGHKTFIIAEAGVNHNGSLELAKKLVDAAVEAGADAVKFQTFKAERVVNKDAKKAVYQREVRNVGESQLEMLRGLELGEEAHKTLFDYCNQKKIVFMSSPFDLEGVEFLNSLGVEIFKIPSGEITNLPYLRRIGSLGKKVILSTGMADLGEIDRALRVLKDFGTPSEEVTVLQCNTEYPTPMSDVNLRAIQTIRENFKVNVGYSDHTLGTEVPIAAVALGASVIEKHFTLDKKMEGPDHKVSLEPQELKRMVRAIRNIEQALGNGIKKVSDSERKNINFVRKSIVAARDIRKGELFTKENITVKRPGTGINPFEWDRIVGKRAKKNFERDEMIEI
jgi:N,N'-diacetyllegionaminate synthase